MVNAYTDIEGTVINVGDLVYYARKRDYSANGILVKERVTKLSNSGVHMGAYLSKHPKSQIVVIKGGQV